MAAWTAFVHGMLEFPLTEAGGFDGWPIEEPVTVMSTMEGWVFSEPPSRPAWMKEYR